jgi:hypothetical protein
VNAPDRCPHCRDPWPGPQHSCRPATAAQPPPKPNEHPAAWDLVLEDLVDALELGTHEYWETHARLVEDIRARDAEGRRKYGVPLQPHNGRDMLVDAYQEALDLVVYLRAAQEEGLPVAKSNVYQRALDIAIDLREMLFERDGK